MTACVFLRINPLLRTVLVCLSGSVVLAAGALPAQETAPAQKSAATARVPGPDLRPLTPWVIHFDRPAPFIPATTDQPATSAATNNTTSGEPAWQQLADGIEVVRTPGSLLNLGPTVSLNDAVKRLTPEVRGQRRPAATAQKPAVTMPMSNAAIPDPSLRKSVAEATPALPVPEPSGLLLCVAAGAALTAFARFRQPPARSSSTRP